MQVAAARVWTVHAKLLGMAMLWGGSWPAGKVVAQALPPLTASVWRFALAFALLLVWWALAAPRKAMSRRVWIGLLLGGLLGVFGYAVCFMLGLQQVGAGRAALVVTTNPVLTLLLAAWWFGERITPLKAAGMALAILGAMTVLTHGAPWRLLSEGLGWGEAILLGCVLCWSGYTLLGKRLLVGVDALTATSATAGFGLLALLLTAGAVEGAEGLAQPLRASPSVWAALVFLAVGATVLAYAWYFEGVKALGAAQAAGYISLVPVFGVLFATLMLGEALEASLLLGGALALAGLTMMQRVR